MERKEKILKPYKGFTIEKDFEVNNKGKTVKDTTFYSAYDKDGDFFNRCSTLNDLKQSIDLYIGSEKKATKKQIKLEVENALQKYDCFHIYDFKILHINNNTGVDFQDYAVIVIGNNSTINIHLLTLSPTGETKVIKG